MSFNTIVAFIAASLILSQLFLNVAGETCRAEIDGHLVPNVRDYLAVYEQVYDSQRTFMNITFDFGMIASDARERYYVLERNGANSNTTLFASCKPSDGGSCRPSFVIDISKTASNIVSTQGQQTYWVVPFYLLSGGRPICFLDIVTAKGLPFDTGRMDFVFHDPVDSPFSIYPYTNYLETVAADLNLEWSLTKNRLLLTANEAGGFPRGLALKELMCKDQYKLTLTTTYRPVNDGDAVISIPRGQAKNYQSCQLAYESGEGAASQAVIVPRHL